MARKKRKGGQPWWRRRRTQRRLAVAASLVVAIGVIAGLVVRAGGDSDSEPKQYFTEPASPFTLPTITGDQVSLADHLGRHNVLLYFNEGMG